MKAKDREAKNLPGNNTARLIVALIAVSIFLAGCASAKGYAMDRIGDDFAQYTVMEILWQVALHENKKTIIPGILSGPEGSIELQWLVDESLNAMLVSTETSGSSELPMRLVKIQAVVFDNGKAALVKDFPPLLNSPLPHSARTIGVVSMKTLFAPLKLSALPEGSTPYRHISSVKWKSRYEKDGMKIGKGILESQDGNIPVFWEKKYNGTSALIMDRDGNQTELIPLFSESSTEAGILEIHRTLADGFSLEYFYYLAKTGKDQLLTGLAGL
ncbi:MAG: hypothetical protein NT061_04370 [Spirochaetes bacterium]|nr:hypothetical protein [Spirochaetota bacterium]